MLKKREASQCLAMGTGINMHKQFKTKGKSSSWFKEICACFLYQFHFYCKEFIQFLNIDRFSATIHEFRADLKQTPCGRFWQPNVTE